MTGGARAVVLCGDGIFSERGGKKEDVTYTTSLVVVVVVVGR